MEHFHILAENHVVGKQHVGAVFQSLSARQESSLTGTVRCSRRARKLRATYSHLSIPAQTLRVFAGNHFVLVRPAGIEPATISLKGSRSTD